MRKIDFTEYKKEDLEIVSLTGEKWLISGNYASDFILKLYDTQKKVEALKDKDFQGAYDIMSQWVLELLKMDKTKERVTKETVKEQFGDIRVMTKLLEYVLEDVAENL